MARLAVVLAVLASVGCAGSSGRRAVFVWMPGDPVPSGHGVELVSHGPATRAVEPAYGPRARVDLPPPPAGVRPVRVRVPAAGIEGPLIDVGLDGRGRLEVPSTAHDVGRYTIGPRPGERGPAVLAGHVQLGRRAGVFAALGDVAPGDLVHVDYDDGSTFVFFVYAREQHPKAAFPTTRVYGDTEGAELRLITCGGVLDRASRHHLDNVVIYADLVARA